MSRLLVLLPLDAVVEACQAVEAVGGSVGLVDGAAVLLEIPDGRLADLLRERFEVIEEG